MSSDEYFDDSEQLDSAFLAELDVIEAAHSKSSQTPCNVASGSQSSAPSFAPPASSKQIQQCSKPAQPKFLREPALPPKPQATASVPIDVDTDETYDKFFDDIDLTELARLDYVEEAYRNPTNAPHSNFASGSRVTRQLTLFGDALSSSVPRTQLQPQSNKSPQAPRNPFGQKARKTKTWDHTAFAKSGWKSSKGKGKEKAKAVASDEEENQSHEEFEQFPAPISEKYSFQAPPPLKLKPDLLAAQMWIYPTNQPKRDYQFNIVRESLFENSLVALPTGLGKTFIAGVLMLNYYRWFPDGKVVFVAPTKPLVAQQIEACHKTCGIPGGDAVELTGQNPRAMRARAWAEKRVFYMTPQTLMNDLKTENCDPTNIILLVIDEAHKATGDYAYAQVVRYLMAKSPHFRILALTATPGAKSEAVQAIVDSLHISNIEIRNENSLDLRNYILPKKISTHIVKMSEDVIKIRDILAKLMEKIAKPCLDNGLLSNLNVVTLHPYRCNALMQDGNRNGVGKSRPWIYASLRKLGSLARAMGYLLECSILMCHAEVQSLSSGVEQDGKKKAGLCSEPLFKELVKEMERQHNAGFSLHPKLDKLQSLAVDYFAQTRADADEAVVRSGLDSSTEPDPAAGESKMMVFTNFRSSVDEIVDLLNAHQPMIRATRFIGQGTDKHGRKGIAQKDQLEVIKKFKGGVYNVLVATSIGEEGLDIGEVDMIICYDAQKTPIRMLQRVGRTGRKRAGRVEVLLSQHREEANWDKAKGDYESVQASIIRGDSLELFGDVERLLPSDIKPKCLESHMAIEEYSRDTKTTNAHASFLKGIKRKRNADAARNIPEGASTGFISSAKLIPKGTAKKRKLMPKDLDSNHVDGDDDDDLAIEAGIHAPAGSKKKSKKGKGTTKVSKKKTVSARMTSPSNLSDLTASQLTREAQDDTDDMDIEKGLAFSSPERPLSCMGPIKTQSLLSPSTSVISVHSSPERPLTAVNTNGRRVLTALGSRQSPLEQDNSWLLDSDEDVVVIEDASPTAECCKSSSLDRSPPTPAVSSTFRHSPLSHVSNEKVRASQTRMLPPPIPAHALVSSDASSELSFPIRPPGIRRKRKRAVQVSSLSAQVSSSGEVRRSSPTPSPPRLPPRKKQRRREPIDSARARLFLDIEAELSGDDIPGGSSDTDDIESESDRRFVQELAATQASPSYNQTAAYRSSLLTQIPGRGNGPHFATKPVRRGTFGGSDRQPRRANISSSPGNELDEYSLDSFVVEDDDEVLDYMRSSGP